VINLDDPLVVAMRCTGSARWALATRNDCADLRLPPGTDEWWLMRRDEPLRPVSGMKIKGLHNAANALARLRSVKR